MGGGGGGGGTRFHLASTEHYEVVTNMVNILAFTFGKQVPTLLLRASKPL